MIIRFAGDSGDGMQLDRRPVHRRDRASLGNDLATLPELPGRDPRARPGTLAGVSAFQIHFASRDILTPGDAPNVLVAMNPAALKANIAELDRGATIIVNEDAFTQAQPREGRLRRPTRSRTARSSSYRVHRMPMTIADDAGGRRRSRASRPRDAGAPRTCSRSGVLSWLYGRPTDVTERWIEKKFARTAGDRRGQPRGASTPAGRSARRPSCSTSSTRSSRRPTCRPARTATSTARPALALGLIAASVRSGLPLLLASYPITPASELLHELSRHAQDRRARRSRPRTRSPPPGWRSAPRSAGTLGVTATSGPGMDLKAETIGLAVDARAADDRDRRAARRALDRDADQDRAVRPVDGALRPPRRVAAAGDRAAHAGGCFDAAIEAARIAIRYRTPVILLSDTFLANVSEPWRLPDASTLPRSTPTFAVAPDGDAEFLPYARDERARAAVGDARDAGARAPDRRPREGRRQRQHLLRPRQPRADDRAARAEGGRDRRRDPAADRRRPSPARACSCSAGARPTAPIRRRRAARPRAAARKVALRAPAAPESVPAQHRRRAAPLRAVLVPEMNTGQLAQLLRGRVPRRRESATTRSRASRCSRPRSSSAIAERAIERGERQQRQRRRADADQGGLPVRPGDALVPGLRRLRDPRPRSSSSCPSSASRPRRSCSSPGSAAPAGSPTT